METKLHVVEVPGNPSIVRCTEAQDLGIITVNVNNLNSTPTSRAQQAANNSELSKLVVQRDFKDCFDKIGRFPGNKYHIQLVEKPHQVIHP